MYNQKLCLSLNSTFGGLSSVEQIKLFKKVGFEAFTGHWNAGCEDDVRSCVKVAKEENMIFHSFHAPWGYAADMWDENEKEDARKGVEEAKEFVDMCSNLEIPMIISHVYVGFDKEHKPTQFGLENYGKIIDYAEGKGIKLAFENTEGEVYLDAILNAFKDRKHVGFCWDSGHEMCYNFSKDLLALYGDRLFATHINDNLGVKDFSGKITWHDDLHLLPFDGIADWDYNAERLKRSASLDILTFELNNDSKPNRRENDKYFNMPIEEYITECYIRACRFARMVGDR